MIIDPKIEKNVEKSSRKNCANYLLAFRKSHVDVGGCFREKSAKILFCQKKSQKIVFA